MVESPPLCEHHSSVQPVLCAEGRADKKLLAVQSLLLYGVCIQLNNTLTQYVDEQCFMVMSEV